MRHRPHAPAGRHQSTTHDAGHAGTRLPRARPAAALVVSLCLLAGALAGCGGSSAGLVLYNGQHEQTTDALVAAFEKQTGISVAVRSDDEDTLAAQIDAEGSGSPADVIYTENSPPLEHLQEQGLLAPVQASTLGQVPARFNSPEGDWVGVSARVSVLIYNTSLVKPGELPRSVMALAEPRWRGRLALAPGETDFQPIVTAVQRAHGTAATLRWLAALKANAGSHVYPDNETITSEVNRGQAAIGVINQYYWYRERAQVGAGAMHSAIAHFAPGDPGYVVDVSGAAVLRSSAHEAAAQRFLAFLVSRAGQEIIAHGTSFEYPLAHGVHTAAHETPFAALRPDPISLADLGDGTSAVALLQRAQLL
ncbi:MAG TPA: extracellular solute-binding protein [Solirubrobacteraceae bacterium]|nr:extracellular solute-binding protein [Solirubrobacteraceae bacterium]